MKEIMEEGDLALPPIGLAHCTCPRCTEQNETPKCGNCGWRRWQWSEVPNDLWICVKCHQTVLSKFQCQNTCEAVLSMSAFAPTNRDKDLIIAYCKTCGEDFIVPGCRAPDRSLNLSQENPADYQECGSLEYTFKCQVDEERLEVTVVALCFYCKAEFTTIKHAECGTVIPVIHFHLPRSVKEEYRSELERIQTIRLRHEEEARQKKIELELSAKLQEEENRWNAATDERSLRQQRLIEAQRARLAALEKKSEGS